MKKNRLIVFKTILVFTSFLMIVSCNRDNSESIVGNPELDFVNKGIELETTPYPDIDLPDLNIDGNKTNAEYEPIDLNIDENKTNAKYAPIGIFKIKYSSKEEYPKEERYYPKGKLIGFDNYELVPGKYKMRVSEAVTDSAGEKYIYFNFRILNEYWKDTDKLKNGPHHLEDYKRFEDGPYYDNISFPDTDRRYRISDQKYRIYLEPPIDSNVVKHNSFGTLLTEYNFHAVIEITGKFRLDNSISVYRGRLISIVEFNKYFGK